MPILDKYRFIDTQGHPLENCLDYQDMLKALRDAASLIERMNEPLETSDVRRRTQVTMIDIDSKDVLRRISRLTAATKAAATKATATKATATPETVLADATDSTPPGDLKPLEWVWGPETWAAAHTGEFLRGPCPRCGDPVVTTCHYQPGQGYRRLWQCWGRMQEPPTCDYDCVPGTVIPKVEERTI